MRVVMLSQDRKLFEEGAVRSRMISYGSVFQELVIIVFGVGEPRESALSPNVRAVFPGGKNKFSALVQGAQAVRLYGAEIHADVLSAQDPFFIGCAGVWAAKRLAISLQVQVHTDCFSFEFLFSSPRRLIEGVVAFFVLKNASCVRVVSTKIERSVKRITSAEVSVLPIRIKAPEQVSGLVPKEFRGNFTILSVSRFSSEKRIHILIDALQFLPSADLVIVGEGHLRKRLESQITRLGLAERVQFAGWQTDLAPYYEHASVFASASRYEGYGLSMAEAALYAVPIVATSAGIVGDTLRNNKECLIASPEARSFADAIRRIQNDSDFARSLAVAANVRIQGHLMSEEAYLARYKEAMHTCTTA